MNTKDRQKINKISLLAETEKKYQNNKDVLTLIRIIKYSVNPLIQKLGNYESQLEEKQRLLQDNLAEIKERYSGKKFSEKKIIEKSRIEWLIDENERSLREINNEIKKIKNRGKELYEGQTRITSSGRKIIPICYFLNKCEYSHHTNDICLMVDEKDYDSQGFPCCDKYLESAKLFIKNGLDNLTQRIQRKSKIKFQ